MRATGRRPPVPNLGAEQPHHHCLGRREPSRARPGALRRVRLQVGGERAALRERLGALRAAERLLPRVDAEVALEVALVGEGLAAQAALEGALASVCALVHHEAALVRRGEVAARAAELAPGLAPWRARDGRSRRRLPEAAVWKANDAVAIFKISRTATSA